MPLLLAHLIVQVQAADHGMMRALFMIAMLMAVLWWSVQKLLGRERGNEVMFNGLWKLVKTLMLLPFKVAGFIFKRIWGDERK